MEGECFFMSYSREKMYLSDRIGKRALIGNHSLILIVPSISHGQPDEEGRTGLVRLPTIFKARTQEPGATNWEGWMGTYSMT